MKAYSLLPMIPADWNAVRDIYAEAIATGNATFETEVPTWEKWDNAHRKDCRLVAVETGAFRKMLGWAVLSPVSTRNVYRGVAEVSVYVAAEARGRRVGTALLAALIGESETAGIWTLQAGIFPENAASISLHKSCGFRQVGIRQKIGRLGNAWRDTVLFERRSTIVGR